jgi:hypothetical protein
LFRSGLLMSGRTALASFCAESARRAGADVGFARGGSASIESFLKSCNRPSAFDC